LTFTLTPPLRNSYCLSCIGLLIVIILLVVYYVQVEVNETLRTLAIIGGIGTAGLFTVTGYARSEAKNARKRYEAAAAAAALQPTNASSTGATAATGSSTATRIAIGEMPEMVSARVNVEDDGVEQAQPETTFCVFCGSELRISGARFCPKCGKEQSY
jgi:hypothetical protein